MYKMQRKKFMTVSNFAPALFNQSGGINDDLNTPSLHGKHSEWWRLEVIINPISRIMNQGHKLFMNSNLNFINFTEK